MPNNGGLPSFLMANVATKARLHAQVVVHGDRRVVGKLLGFVNRFAYGQGRHGRRGQVVVNPAKNLQ